MPVKQITRSVRAQRVLKAARAAKGLTQENVAAKLKVTRSTLSMWEKDIYNVDLDKYLMLCKIYGIDAKQIIELK